jgi:hypothetical protein
MATLFSNEITPRFESSLAPVRSVCSLRAAKLYLHDSDLVKIQKLFSSVSTSTSSLIMCILARYARGSCQHTGNYFIIFTKRSAGPWQKLCHAEQV